MHIREEFLKTVPLVIMTALLVSFGVSQINFECVRWYVFDLYYLLFVFTILNNIYQVFTHVLTAVKFFGFDICVPGGANDNQTILNFTIHNQLDLWGWWAYFILKGDVPLIYNLLSSTHIATGMFAFYNPKVFQDYYIKTGECPRVFHTFKIVFVLSDAIARSYALLTLL